jgi:hypothetical protein
MTRDVSLSRNTEDFLLQFDKTAPGISSLPETPGRIEKIEMFRRERGIEFTVCYETSLKEWYIIRSAVIRNHAIKSPQAFGKQLEKSGFIRMVTHIHLINAEYITFHTS